MKEMFSHARHFSFFVCGYEINTSVNSVNVVDFHYFVKNNQTTRFSNNFCCSIFKQKIYCNRNFDNIFKKMSFDL